MTVEELSGLYYLRKLIEIEERCASDNRDDDEWRDQLLDRWKREERRLTEYIDSVPDVQVRLILLLRYVKLMSWDQVAAKVGGGNTAQGVMTTALRYIRRSAGNEKTKQ